MTAWEDGTPAKVITIDDTCNYTGARLSSTMSSYEDPHPKKKVTAATTDAPQEEFIEQENVPSKVEKPADKKPDRSQGAEPSK